MRLPGPYVFVQGALRASLFWETCVCFILFFVLRRYASRWWISKENTLPVSLSNFSIFNIIPFVYNRYDFLSLGFQATGETVFRFRLLNKLVVAVSGKSGRTAFLTGKDLEVLPGSMDLFGIPVVRGIDPELHGKTVALIRQRLLMSQSQASLSNLILPLLEDCRKAITAWGKVGRIDPFLKVDQLTFQLLLRGSTGAGIADNPTIVNRLKYMYDELDEGNTPAAIFFPWWPGRGLIRKLRATKTIYDTIVQATEARRKSEKPQDDTLQMLLDKGDDNTIVAGFVMGFITGGARPTGTTASWLLIYLGGLPEWKAKAKAEAESLVFTNSSTPYKAGSSLSDLSTTLSQIPLDAWEGSTPVLDALIRETTRLAQGHTAGRKNVGPDMYIDGKRIPSGHYLVYPFSDVHLNEELYPDPWKFDPDRPRPDSPYSYIGWGAGKVTCLGQRLAKVQLKLFLAMFLLGTEFSAVDKEGKLLETIPRPDWNDPLGYKPPKDSCFVQYEVKG